MRRRDRGARGRRTTSSRPTASTATPTRRASPRAAIMAELYGKKTGARKGLGGSMHLFDKATNFLGGYGIVGGHVPLAAGVAFASKYRGDGRVTLCFFGEGASTHRRLPRGPLARRAVEAARRASSARTTSTRWARRSTARSRVEDVSLKALALRHARAIASTATTCSRSSAASPRRSSARASTGEPTLVEVVTYRFRGHSMSDPGHYRTKDEVEEWKKARSAQPLRAQRLRRARHVARRTSTALEADVETGDRGRGEVRRGVAAPADEYLAST